MNDAARHAARARPGLRALLLGLAFGSVGAAVLGALLAPAAYAAVEALAPGSFPFQRVFRRVTMLVALVALTVGLRAAGVRRWADVGLGRVRGRGRVVLVGAAWGAAAVVFAFVVELALGHRTSAVGALTPARVAEAFGSGAAVGLLEEGVCRGALLFPFGPLSGARLAAANVATSALYSTAHFLRGGGRVTEVDAWSGFRVLSGLPGAIAPLAEAWVGLFLTGALLYVVAARQGHAWGAAGAHAGAVVVLQVLGTATAPRAGSDSLFLVDGLWPGWGLSALLAVALAVVALRGRPAPPHGAD